MNGNFGNIFEDKVRIKALCLEITKAYGKKGKLMDAIQWKHMKRSSKLLASIREAMWRIREDEDVQTKKE